MINVCDISYTVSITIFLEIRGNIFHYYPFFITVPYSFARWALQTTAAKWYFSKIRVAWLKNLMQYLDSDFPFSKPSFMYVDWQLIKLYYKFILTDTKLCEYEQKEIWLLHSKKNCKLIFKK